MAGRFCDGFDHYSSGAQKWTASNILGFASATPRFGVGKYIQTGNNGVVSKVFDNQGTWIVGVAFRKTSSFLASTMISLRDGTTTQVDLRMNALAGLEVTRNGTLLASSAGGILVLDAWYFVELKTTIHNTAGTYEVRLNGTPVSGLSATGQNTRATTNNYANTLMLGGFTTDYDDVYLCDSTGTKNNDFLGDGRADTIWPVADILKAFTPSTGTDNYAMVDDATPDEDSTYNASGTVGNKDLYTYESLESLSGTVHFLQSVIRGRKDDAGARSVAPAIRTGATDAVGADFVLSASHLYNLQIFETNPADSGADWTISSVNNSKFGVQVTA